MGEANAAKRRAMYPSLSWTPKVRIRDVDAGDEGRGNQYDSRKRHKSSTTSAVPSLSSLCVDFLVANFDCIESLGGVDSQVRECEEHPPLCLCMSLTPPPPHRHTG